LIIIALFKLIPITLTLAGIAGFILSIGMAVDANILIFERTKEELFARKTIGLSIDDGFRRAWPSIRDSNFSSLITCLILYYGTSGLVRGFAVTLAIGILVSMFTAITVSRTFLKLLVGTRLEKYLVVK
jgi:preprotein translocase subunit SecD